MWPCFTPRLSASVRVSRRRASAAGAPCTPRPSGSLSANAATQHVEQSRLNPAKECRIYSSNSRPWPSNPARKWSQSGEAPSSSASKLLTQQWRALQRRPRQCDERRLSVVPYRVTEQESYTSGNYRERVSSQVISESFSKLGPGSTVRSKRKYHS